MVLFSWDCVFFPSVIFLRSSHNIKAFSVVEDDSKCSTNSSHCCMEGIVYSRRVVRLMFVGFMDNSFMDSCGFLEWSHAMAACSGYGPLVVLFFFATSWALLSPIWENLPFNTETHIFESFLYIGLDAVLIKRFLLLSVVFCNICYG